MEVVKFLAVKVGNISIFKGNRDGSVNFEKLSGE